MPNLGYVHSFSTRNCAHCALELQCSPYDLHTYSFHVDILNNIGFISMELEHKLQHCQRLYALRILSKKDPPWVGWTKCRGGRHVMGGRRIEAEVVQSVQTK